MPEQGAIARTMQEGVAQGVAPAMVLLLCHGQEQTVYCAGRAEAQTVFDLASLTKPLATALLILELECKGLLPWRITLGELWGPAVPPDKTGISLLQLLAHSSGYQAYETYFKLLNQRPQSQRQALLKAMLMNQPLAAAPGSQALYSDLGYMLLGLVIEDALDTALDEALNRLQDGLGLDGPRYLPLDAPPLWPLERIAPCGPLPGRELIHGQVEDENAHALGGVAGHAGLFGTAAQVANIMRAITSAARGEGAWPREKAGLMLIRDPAIPGSPRTPGFDTPSKEHSAAGDNPPPGVVGHLGFTGVSLWWQPQTDRGVVLLTNRVALGRENRRIEGFRNLIHNLAWRELEG